MAATVSASATHGLTGTSWVVPLPAHAADDVLLLHIAGDNNTSVITGGLGAFTLLVGPTDNSGTADVRGWFYGVLASGTVSDPTITFDVAIAGGVGILVISGADVTGGTLASTYDEVQVLGTVATTS